MEAITDYEAKDLLRKARIEVAEDPRSYLEIATAFGLVATRPAIAVQMDVALQPQTAEQAVDRV